MGMSLFRMNRVGTFRNEHVNFFIKIGLFKTTWLRNCIHRFWLHASERHVIATNGNITDYSHSSFANIRMLLIFLFIILLIEYHCYTLIIDCEFIHQWIMKSNLALAALFFFRFDGFHQCCVIFELFEANYPTFALLILASPNQINLELCGDCAPFIDLGPMLSSAIHAFP